MEPKCVLECCHPRRSPESLSETLPTMDCLTHTAHPKRTTRGQWPHFSPRTICRRAEWILWVDFSLTYDRAAWHLHRFRMLPNFSTRTNGLKSAFATNQNWAKLPMDCHEAKLGQDYEGLLTEVLPPSLLTRPSSPSLLPPVLLANLPRLAPCFSATALALLPAPGPPPHVHVHSPRNKKRSRNTTWAREQSRRPPSMPSGLLPPIRCLSDSPILTPAPLTHTAHAPAPVNRF